MGLIIAEKPKVARKIAEFLSKGNYKSIKYKRGVYYYIFELNNERFFVVSALGHLFTLSTPNKNWSYPVFDYKWVPAYLEDKITIKKYYMDLFQKFKDEKNIIIATDFDIEGELIGYNILRFIFHRKNARRMIFSAITYKDIWNAFINKNPNIYINFAEAGETRHIVDWLYGINLSRALTHAVRKYLPKIVLSIGRVQGPTLYLVYLKEKEIREFIPETYYTVAATIEKNGRKIKFKHVAEKFKSKSDAEKVVQQSKGLALVEKIIISKEKENPPYPYNLSDLQQDAYKFYKISPKKTLDIAQRLYESGYISYPRTSSQKLPPTINYIYIIKNLSKMNVYSKYANILLSKENLIPNNGPKEDVHPAIHPTGLLPRNISKKEFLIYDLIVRRFLATYMDHAIINKIKVIAKLGKEEYFYEYKNIYEIGWLIVYYKFIKDSFESLVFREKEILNVQRISVYKKKTKPPARYNQATLIKEMEKLNIGTKATRSEIVSILYKRNYIEGRSIKITTVGERILQIFDKYIPEILSIDLTRKLEKELEEIEDGKLWKKEEVINEVKETTKNVCEEFRQKEDQIGKELYGIIREYLKSKISKKEKTK